MTDSKKTLLPALLAVGTGLAAYPATALELGEINVQSTLGQPLRASIAYALGPNEQLADYCVTLKPGIPGNGLPSITRADVTVGAGVISLTGKTIVRDLMLTVRVNVACPYTPNLSREYTLLIDPAAQVTPAISANDAAVSSNTAATIVRNRPAVERVSRVVSAVSTTPIAASGQYRVQRGDSLSLIAERIENRPVALWDAVTQIFEANPDAFIDNDMNKLKAGSLLVIPNFSADSRNAATAPATAAAPVVDSGAAAIDAVNTVVDTAAEPPPIDAFDDTAVLEPAGTPDVTDLRPGDLVIDTPTTNVVIPDTSIDAPTTSTSPNVPTASVVTPDAPVESTTNWLLWLFGGGIALIAGLLAFGRRNREEYEPEPVVPVAPHPMRRSSDSITVEVLAEPGYDLDDDSPTAENLALDADLVVGTGLQEGTDIDVNQDFGFAATTALDIEFPEESESQDVTDMMAAPTVEEITILDEEVLPDDDDYDMSVIVDATKMPRPDEVTERDLKAVEIESGDESLITDAYTVSQEVDYQILEQDYEEELTATQALNIEIEKAAAELANRMETDDDDRTAEMKLATVTPLDVTSKMPVDEADPEQLVDTGFNEEITENMLAEEKTVEMPRSENDDTIEMTVESGKVDTKAS